MWVIYIAILAILRVNQINIYAQKDLYIYSLVPSTRILFTQIYNNNYSNQINRFLAAQKQTKQYAPFLFIVCV